MLAEIAAAKAATKAAPRKAYALRSYAGVRLRSQRTQLAVVSSRPAASHSAVESVGA